MIHILKNKKIWAVVVCVLVLIAVLSQCRSWGFYDKNAQDGLLDGRTQEEIDELLSETVSEGMFKVSINSNPVFLDGGEQGNLRIENSPGNVYDLRVEIRLKDSGKLVYRSGGIKPHQYIEMAALSKNLEAGTYQADVNFIAVDSKKKDVGLVTKEITITVLE